MRRFVSAPIIAQLVVFLMGIDAIRRGADQSRERHHTVVVATHNFQRNQSVVHNLSTNSSVKDISVELGEVINGSSFAEMEDEGISVELGEDFNDSSFAEMEDEDISVEFGEDFDGSSFAEMEDEMTNALSPAEVEEDFNNVQKAPEIDVAKNDLNQSSPASMGSGRQAPTLAPSSFLQSPSSSSRHGISRNHQICITIHKKRHLIPPQLLERAELSKKCNLGRGRHASFLVFGNKDEYKTTTVKVSPSFDEEGLANLKQFKYEAAVMSLMGKSSNYVVSPIGQALEYRGRVWMMMPFHSRGVFADIVFAKKQPYSRTQLAVWMFQIVLGLAALHARGIAHLNLQLQDILIHCQHMETRCHATIADLKTACVSPGHKKFEISESPCTDDMEEDVCLGLVNAELEKFENAAENRQFFRKPENIYKKFYPSLLQMEQPCASSDMKVFLKAIHYPVTVAYVLLPGDCQIRGAPGSVGPEAINEKGLSEAFKVLNEKKTQRAKAETSNGFDRRTTDLGAMVYVKGFSNPSTDLWTIGALLYRIAVKQVKNASQPGLYKGQRRASKEYAACAEILKLPPLRTKSNPGILRYMNKVYRDNLRTPKERECAEILKSQAKWRALYVLHATLEYKPEEDPILKKVEPPELRHLLMMLLNPNPQERYGIFEIIQDMPEVIKEMSKLEGDGQAMADAYIENVYMKHASQYMSTPDADLGKPWPLIAKSRRRAIGFVANVT